MEVWPTVIRVLIRRQTPRIQVVKDACNLRYLFVNRAAETLMGAARDGADQSSENMLINMIADRTEQATAREAAA